MTVTEDSIMKLILNTLFLHSELSLTQIYFDQNVLKVLVDPSIPQSISTVTWSSQKKFHNASLWKHGYWRQQNSKSSVCIFPVARRENNVLASAGNSCLPQHTLIPKGILRWAFDTRQFFGQIYHIILSVKNSHRHIMNIKWLTK